MCDPTLPVAAAALLSPAPPVVDESPARSTPGPVAFPPRESPTPTHVPQLLDEVDLCAAGYDPLTEDEDAGDIMLFGQSVSHHHRERVCDGPCARFGHTAVVHDNTMVVFGGRKDNRCFNDVWTCEFPAKTWRERVCTKAANAPVGNPRGIPTARAGHTAVIHDGAMYVFGGVDEDGVQWFNDLWKLDLTTWAWLYMESASELFRPEPRKGHTAMMYNGCMYIFGGGVDGAEPLVLYNDLWEINFATRRWRACNYMGQIPEPRMYHTACMREGGRMVIFGGRVEREIGFVNDTIEVDLNAMRAKELVVQHGVPPNPRMCSTAILHNNTMAVFTGGAYSYLEDSHQLHLDTMTWRQVPPTLEFGGRTRPTTVLWRDTLFTFGGCITSNAYVDDYVEIKLKPVSLRKQVLRMLAEPRVLPLLRADIATLPPSLKEVLKQKLRRLRQAQRHQLLRE